MNNYYAFMGIPPKFYNKTLDNYVGDVAKLKEALVSGKSIFLTGRAGTGKTHLAVGLMIEWAKKKDIKSTKDFPLFLPSVEFFLELKDSFDKTISEKDILDKYSAQRLFCIDDVGNEKVSEWSRQVFYALIDRRYRNELQTIITSNLSLDTLAVAIDDRIASRIVGMGVVIELTGEDYRMRKQ